MAVLRILFSETHTNAMNMNQETCVLMHILTSNASDYEMAMKLFSANSCGSSNLISVCAKRDIMLIISVVLKEADVNRNHEHVLIVLETLTRE